MAAPSLPGVYAIGKVTSEFGLPTNIEWGYVGRSANLRRRLTQHDPLVESHPHLPRWLARSGSSVEVWYAVADLSAARRLEEELIRRIRPKMNRIHYKKSQPSPPKSRRRKKP